MEILLFNNIKMHHNLRHNCLSLRKIHQAFTRNPTKKQWNNIKFSGILLLSVPIGTFCLGTWQVYRRKWKLQLIENLQNLTMQPPIPFPESVEDIEKLEYRKVKMFGEFDHSQELYIGPRPKLVGGDVSDQAGGLISSGQSGYNVITPFTLADTRLTILVNRGWIPRKFMNPSTRPEGQVSGPVSLTGVVRRHETRAPFMPENKLQSIIFTYRDVIRMAELTGSSPIFLDAVETCEGGPVGGQTRVTLRNEHLNYIFTWYTLSAITSYMWHRRFILGKTLI